MLIVHTEKRQLLYGTNSAALTSILFHANYLQGIISAKVAGLHNTVHAVFELIKGITFGQIEKECPLFYCRHGRKACW